MKDELLLASSDISLTLSFLLLFLLFIFV